MIKILVQNGLFNFTGTIILNNENFPECVNFKSSLCHNTKKLKDNITF